MKLKTPAYDALDNLLPETEYEVVSAFTCEGTYVLGFWVQGEGNLVEPRYLTEEQRNALT